MAVSITKAGSADISKLSGIIRHAYKDVAQRFSLTPENCPKHPSNCTDEWVQSDLDRGVIYYVLERNQDICGCTAMEKAGPDICYLERLSILPKYRRKGLGSMLVHHIFQEAQALGVSNVGIGIISQQHELKKMVHPTGVCGR
jgi:GNAT superfamily N-acetyltransferase